MLKYITEIEDVIRFIENKIHHLKNMAATSAKDSEMFEKRRNKWLLKIDKLEEEIEKEITRKFNI